jgi:hypothetical protein
MRNESLAADVCGVSAWMDVMTVGRGRTTAADGALRRSLSGAAQWYQVGEPGIEERWRFGAE